MLIGKVSNRSLKNEPVPPVVVNDCILPAQIVGFAGVITIVVGTGFTITVTSPVVVQVALLAVTVYFVVVVGETEIEVPDAPPGDHKKLVKVPEGVVLAVKVVDCPSQILAGEAFKISKSGGAVTVAVIAVLGDEPHEISYFQL